MPTQPLQPFAPPAILFSHFPTFFSAGTIVIWFCGFVFAWWVVYTLIATYHWFKYSNASWVMFPAVGAHLFISFVLISFALYGTFTV